MSGADEGEGIFAAKTAGLLVLLSKVSFHQAVVFCNQQEEASWLASHLTARGFPAAFICGEQ
jgi:superfamily II DNA/RNA helicase